MSKPKGGAKPKNRGRRRFPRPPVVHPATPEAIAQYQAMNEMLGATEIVSRIFLEAMPGTPLTKRYLAAARALIDHALIIELHTVKP